MQNNLFPKFENSRVRIGDYDVFYLSAGAGSPLLLLHGYPQTHHVWAKVASKLLEHHRVIIPDLPGYGASFGPAPDISNRNYSKKSVASVMVQLMSELGHGSFGIVAHDRGARIAFRMALDHQERVTKLMSLDTVPTLDVWESMGWRGANEAFHWPFLAQSDGIPEAMINADPDLFIGHLLRRWAGDFNRLDPNAVNEYLSAFHNKAVIDATCADYRAGATADVEDDTADRNAGRRIHCPVQVLWGDEYSVGSGTSPIDIWRRWADDVDGSSLPCGHFVAEERPNETAATILSFF